MAPGSRERAARPARPALVLAALLLPAVLLPALLGPVAQAAPPREQPWGSLSLASVGAGSATSLALDEAGTSAVVGTTDAGQNAGDPDFVRILWAEGNLSAADEQNSLGQGEGLATVALSGDGSRAVAGGNFSGSSLLVGPNIHYYRLPDMDTTWTATKGEPASTATISHDGSVLAVGTRNSTSGTGRVYRYNGAGTQVWQANANACGGVQGDPGTVLALDLSRDGKWLVVGTGFVANGEATGCVLLFDTASLTPVMAHAVPFAGGGEVTAVDISANGQWFAAGTRGGRFFMYQNTAQGRDNPMQEQLNALQPVVGLRVPEDGAGIAVADGSSVSRYTQRAGLLSLDWLAPAPGVRSLDMTRDGEYILAGASQLLAFHKSSNHTLWAVDMASALVRVANPAPGDVRVLAASGDTVRGFTLHWGLEVRKTEPEPLALQPGQARPYTFELLNTGSAADTFDLSVRAPGFTAGVQPPRVTLRPGEAGNVTLTVSPGPNAEASFYRLDVEARGVFSGVTATATVNATVGAVPRVALALADPSQRDRPVLQGDEVDIVLQVQNTGNSRLDLAYDVAQRPNVGGPWDATLSRTSGSVDCCGAVSTNTLRVQVPPNALNGTENIVTVTARGDGVESAVTARLVVNPSFTVSVDVVPPSRVVEPGKSVAYTVTVANNGTLAERYRVSYCTALPDFIPCLGNATLGLGGWSVAVDTSPFELGPGQQRPFQLVVGAPRGALPGVDKLVLQVEAISATPQAFQHGFRDFKVVTTAVREPVPTAPPPAFTPGFEALAVLGALGAAAAALRRRA